MSRRQAPATAAAALCLFLALAWATPAAAGPPAATSTWASTPLPVTFEGDLNLFNALMFDTGWLPAGSPVQVRFQILFGTGFTCTMDGTAELQWPPPLDLSFTPTPGTGELVMDMGIEVHSLYRLDLSVGALSFYFEGELPFLPNFDYRFADMAGFDPFLLPGGAPGMVTVMDSIQDSELYAYDITDLIIPIPGIGGGISLWAGGSLDATLMGIEIDVSPEVVTMAGEHVYPAVPGTDPALLRDAVWRGELLLNGTLVLTPTIFVELLGATWNVASFPIMIPLPSAPVPWDLDPWPLDFPLPEIEVVDTGIAFGLVSTGTNTVQTIPLSNDGDLPLQVTLTTDGPPFAPNGAGMFVVPPHSAGVAAVLFSPLSAGPWNGTLFIESNDPDEPMLAIALTGSADGPTIGGSDAGPPPTDAGPMTDAGADSGVDADAGDDGMPGGCRCRLDAGSGSGPGTAMLLVALLPLAVAVRRRRDRRSSK